MALTDKNKQVKFGLMIVLECLDMKFLGTTTSFQRSNIHGPQQPWTEKVSNISEKLDFLMIH